MAYSQFVIGNRCQIGHDIAIQHTTHIDIAKPHVQTSSHFQDGGWARD